MKASEVLNLAKSWIGLNGADGSHKSIIDIYNTQKPLPRGYKVSYKDSWCATFITALFVKLGATNLIYPECSCEDMINGMKKMGIWIEDESIAPAAGDIVFYDWQDNGKGDCTGWADHVGIVEKVNAKTVTVIEGNKSNSVARRNVTVNQIYLRGYAKPKYSAETSSSTTSKKSNEEIANEVIAGKWGSGTSRKTKLTAAGYDYNAIQSIVNSKLSSGSKSGTTSNKYKCTAKSGLYVRNGAGTSYNVVGSLICNETFEVTTIKNNWGYIPSKRGWCSLNYAKKV